MLALKYKPQPKPKIRDDDDAGNATKFIRREPPPFVTHFKSSEGVKYTIGSTLVHDGNTFYFCDCPLHRNKLKWHTHHPDKCRIRNRWLKEKDTKSPATDATASSNISVENDAYDDTSPSADDTSASSSANSNQSNPGIQALLASAMNLVIDNDVAKDFICETLNAYTDV